ncbi:Serine protease 27 [Scophthalmus maximus]|uniref:Serine protease 27 n=1 Tax=Scophthalmus maximus TaxID=52904 RepID=A0A2U9CLY5_SCOMX|nr:Serine protease 27 [Scophthalmus maximus]
MALMKWICALTLSSLLTTVCGAAPLNTRIVGGEDAPPGSWPWQVSLQRFGGHVCGGSLINREWVMSAAHCFFSTSTSGWQVSLGRQNLQGTNPNEVSTTVARIILHPNYDSDTNNNDIALLRLSSPVKFTDYIRPVCLAASGSVFNNGTDCWVTGWGAVKEGESLPLPETLQEVEVPVLGNRQCNCLNGVGTVTDNMICAGVLAGGKDSCQGDSGGPMVSKQGSVWVQSGVVSFGFGCARPNLPGVYSRVSRYQSWINSFIRSDRPGFVQFTSKWVMSAAHCFFSTSTSGWQVSLGRQNLQGTNPNEVSTTVARIILHPNYDSDTNNNDIALLRLSSPVKFTDYIRPVCLAASGSVFNNGTDCWVTGWGAVKEGESLPLPETLQEVEVPVLGNRQCNCLNGVGTVTDNMICAGVLAGGKDSCQGDSGGPMVSKQGSVWVQSGVVSFGFGCARPNLPGVYSRVSRYQSWINSFIRSDRPGFVQFTSSGPDADSSYTCLGLPPSPTTSSTTRPSTVIGPARPVCGKASMNSRAVGDSGLVHGGTWPWIVSLHKNGVYTCVGTLIADDFVLTASQCFSTPNPNVLEWRVFLGHKLVDSSEEFEMSLGVVKITLSKMTGSNIAVLQLAKPVSFKDYIQPVCVDSNNDRSFPIGSQCWVAGWGQGSKSRAGSGLRDLETEVVNCGNIFDTENICTHGMDLQKADQGGPLLCKSDSSWFQVAVVTMSGNKSIRADIQAFAKTSRFGSFLKETVGDMPSPPVSATGNAPGNAVSLFFTFAVLFTSMFLL